MPVLMVRLDHKEFRGDKVKGESMALLVWRVQQVRKDYKEFREDKV